MRHILIALLEFHVLEPPDQENAAALAQMHGLHDEYLVALFRLGVGELVFEVVHLRRQDPSLREEVVVVFVELLHAHEVSA